MDSVTGQGAPVRVLVVDDEAIARAVATRMLEKAGFEVVAAADGDAAVQIVAEQGDFGAVLLDLAMPGKDGVETLKELGQLRGALPVILCSGYSAAEASRRFAELDVAGFLQKPFTFQGLTEVVRRVVARSRAR
jgi:two-component system cell cycle sensor histidine kinase/response regulator CckA